MTKITERRKLDGIRVYRSHADRQRAIAQLRRQNYNYFTRYPDVQGYGLSYAKVSWNPEGRVYIS